MSQATDPQTCARLVEFLQARTKTDVDPGQDLFASGLLSSLFALQLVVHLEQEFGVSVAGEDLRIDNFRSVDAMAALVARLGGAAGG